jgi:hypothetical protein
VPPEGVVVEQIAQRLEELDDLGPSQTLTFQSVGGRAQRVLQV